MDRRRARLVAGCAEGSSRAAEGRMANGRTVSGARSEKSGKGGEIGEGGGGVAGGDGGSAGGESGGGLGGKIGGGGLGSGWFTARSAAVYGVKSSSEAGAALLSTRQICEGREHKRARTHKRPYYMKSTSTARATHARTTSRVGMVHDSLWAA